MLLFSKGRSWNKLQFTYQWGLVKWLKVTGVILGITFFWLLFNIKLLLTLCLVILLLLLLGITLRWVRNPFSNLPVGKSKAFDREKDSRVTKQSVWCLQLPINPLKTNTEAWEELLLQKPAQNQVHKQKNDQLKTNPQFLGSFDPQQVQW